MDINPDWTVPGIQSPITVVGSSAVIGKFRGPSQPPSIAIQVGGTVRVFHAVANGVPSSTNLNAPSQTITPPGMNGTITSLANGGNMVGTLGDSLVIGAPAKTGSGQVFVFRSQGSAGLVSTPTQTLLESSTTCPNGSGFGAQVANVKDVDKDNGVKDDLVVTADTCGPSGSVNRGRAFLFTGGASAVSATSWSFDGPSDNADLRVVAALGDVNCDGEDDFALGAPGFSADNGKVWIFLGATAANTLPSTVEFTSFAGGANGRYGAAIAGGKDVNRDGCSDFIVGAPNYSNDVSTPNEGKVYVTAGAPTAAALFTLQTSSGNCAACQVGAAVGMGRFDAIGATFDRGFEDAVWGAPGAEDTSTVNEGVVVVRVGTW